MPDTTHEGRTTHDHDKRHDGLEQERTVRVPEAGHPRETVHEEEVRSGSALRSGAAGVARIVLAAGAVVTLIVAAITEWRAGLEADQVSLEIFTRVAPETTDRFLTSAGFATIVVALVVILGVAFAGGWLMRLAGAVAIAGAVMVGVQELRADGGGVEQLGIGVWLLLAGGVIAVIAGFVVPGRSRSFRRRTSVG